MKKYPISHPIYTIFSSTNTLHRIQPGGWICRINSMNSYPIIEIDAVRKAHSIVREQANRTPIRKCPEISEEVQNAVFEDHGASVPMLELFFKCETLQKAGSFKFRGACHFLSQLTEKELRAGVVSYSTGKAKPNHFYSQNLLGIKGTMPSL